VRVVYSEVSDYQYELGDGTGSNYQLTWTPSYAGTFLIAATAYDSEGASGTSVPITITVLSPGDPTVTITSPANGTSIYPGQTLTVHAAATAVLPAEVYEMDFFDGNQYLGSKYSPPFEVQWSPYGVGSHTLTAYVYDTFGGFAQTSVTINVIEPPNLGITLVQPLPNIPIRVNSPATLAATIENVIGTLQGVQFYVNGQWIGDGSSSSVTWTPTAIGDYEIGVYAYSYDPYQDGYIVVNVTVADLHSPVVQWTSPANNASFAPNTPIVLQAQANDIDADLSRFQFLADGQLLSETQVSGGAGVVSFTWNNPHPGWHKLGALAIDNAQLAGAATSRVFIPRAESANLFPPRNLAASPASSTVTVNWEAPDDLVNNYGYAIERKVGRQGEWQEIGTVDSTANVYADTGVDSQTYYVYRVASLAQDGAISSYTNEAVAVSRTAASRYAIIDLGDSLQQSGVAGALPGGPESLRTTTAQKGGLGLPTSSPIDASASKAMSISDDGDILLATVDQSGVEMPGHYIIWRAGRLPLPHFEDKFTAVRITKDGAVVGSVDKTRMHSDIEVTETHGVYWEPNAWESPSASAIDITPTPEAYARPEFSENVDVDWLLTHQTSSSRAWWTPADPNASAKFPWELIWRSRIADRNRSGWMVGEATIVRQSQLWSEWQALAISNPFQAEGNAPFTDAGSSLLWSTGAQDPPQWSYLLDGLYITAEASAFALNDNGASVGGLAFNTSAADYYPRFGDNLPRTHAFRGTGAQNGQQFDDLGTLGDGRFSWAWDINNAGVATGYSTLHTADEVWRTQAVVWESNATTPTALPTLFGTNASYPDGYGYSYAINDRGQIVGQSLAINTLPGPDQPPVISAATIWLKNAANDPTVPAFMQDPRWEVTNLNTRIDSMITEELSNGQRITYRKWHLDVARGINKNGWIVGTGVRTRYDAQNNQLVSESRSFLLVPVEVITINSFIPQDHVSKPFSLTHIFEGDNRMDATAGIATWDKDGSYRTREQFTVIPFQSMGDFDGLENNAYANDPDGITNDEWFIGIGTTREYHEGSSLLGGKISAAAKADTILGDNYLKTGEATASKSGMKIEPVWQGERKVKVHCVGHATNPLFSILGIPAPAIDYDVNIIIDFTDQEHPKYTLQGDHDGFPAYEFYINDSRIYEHDPIATGQSPLSLGPPMEFSIPETKVNQPIP
jgi:hypothetical protein